MTQIITYLIILVLAALSFTGSPGTSEDADIVSTPDEDIQEEDTTPEDDEITEEDETIEEDEEAVEEDEENAEVDETLALDSAVSHETYIDGSGLFNFSEGTIIPTSGLSSANVAIIEELLAVYENNPIDRMQFDMQLNHLMNIMNRLYTSSGTDYLAQAPEEAIDENGQVDVRVYDIPLAEYLNSMTDGQVTRFAQLENGIFLGSLSTDDYYDAYNLLLNQVLNNLE